MAKSTHHTTADMVKAESSAREYTKFALVVWFILLASLWPTYADGLASADEWMRWFMGFFLVTFAGFKFIGFEMFALMFAEYDIVAKRSRLYALAYPFIEFGLGVLYLADLGAPARDAVTLAVMAVGAVGVWRAIAARRGVHCACLGNVIKLPLSSVSLVEDLAMGAMAAFMLLGA
jgi:hypothetical protein